MIQFVAKPLNIRLCCTLYVLEKRLTQWGSKALGDQGYSAI